MVTTPDKRYSFKIDFQQTKQTRERPQYFLQIWSDHENERRAFANNSTRVASIVRFQIPTYKLHVLSSRFFLHLRYSNMDEIYGPAYAHIVLTGPPSRIPSLAKTLSQNAKTSRGSLFRTTLRPLFEVHTTTVLELRLFHKTRDFQRPRWNIHEAQNSLDFMRDIREFLWIPCSPQRARSLS